MLYNKSLKQRARELRKNMTPEEQILWEAIRYKQINGLQFYRQRPIWQYIVDFYCPAVKLAIELDGAHHILDPNQKEYDILRDQSLWSLGVQVLRFTNVKIQNDLEKVTQMIKFCLKNPPQPLL